MFKSPIQIRHVLQTGKPYFSYTVSSTEATRYNSLWHANAAWDCILIAYSYLQSYIPHNN